jgi:hypothetical protein
VESRTVCGPAKTVFGEKIRRSRSPAAGHPRPPRGVAEHEARRRKSKAAPVKKPKTIRVKNDDEMI